jgi:predicted RNA methylase
MQQYQNALKRITEILLNPVDHYGELAKASDDLFRLFLTVSGMDVASGENKEHIYLPGGKAIGSLWAALCIKEHLRTKRFLCGFRQGIIQALATFPVRPIHILYAGTGPFATLALPLTTVFSSAEISFTFLEINPESVQCLEKVIAAFQIEQYVNEIIQCDAATFQADKSKPVHMIVTETMQNALQKEPQVAITMNLVPQMADGGVLIPQNITIEAALVDPRRNMERMASSDMHPEDCYRVLDKIFELNKDTPKQYQPAASAKDQAAGFPKVEVEIPEDIPLEYRQLCLMTTIQVFAAEQIAPWQCSLTLPQNLTRLDPAKKRPRKVTFQYRMDSTPGFGLETVG